MVEHGYRRRHGLELPLAGPQVYTWIVVGVSIVVFGWMVLPVAPEALRWPAMAAYLVLFVVGLAAFVRVSLSDPGVPDEKTQQWKTRKAAVRTPHPPSGPAPPPDSNNGDVEKSEKTAEEQDDAEQVVDDGVQRVCVPNVPQCLQRTSDAYSTHHHNSSNVYCHTCEMYMAKETKHCRICNKCIDVFDHHCLYLNTCVGHRNYWTFFTLITIVSLFTGMQVGVTLHVLTNLDDAETAANVRDSMFGSKTTYLAVVACMSIFPLGGFLAVFSLWCFHCYITLLEVTTYGWIIKRRRAAEMAENTRLDMEMAKRRAANEAVRAKMNEEARARREAEKERRERRQRRAQRRKELQEQRRLQKEQLQQRRQEQTTQQPDHQENEEEEEAEDQYEEQETVRETDDVKLDIDDGNNEQERNGVSRHSLSHSRSRTRSRSSAENEDSLVRRMSAVMGVADVSMVDDEDDDADDAEPTSQLRQREESIIRGPEDEEEQEEDNKEQAQQEDNNDQEVRQEDDDNKDESSDNGVQQAEEEAQHHQQAEEPKQAERRSEAQPRPREPNKADNEEQSQPADAEQALSSAEPETAADEIREYINQDDD